MTSRVAIVGAGAVGGFLAMELASVGVDVLLVDPLIAEGLCDWSRAVCHDGCALLPLRQPVLDRSYDGLRAIELCLITVKSRHTRAVAEELAATLPPTATVISLQNGLHNPDTLRAALGDRVAAGVVTFNARIDEDGRRLQTSAGRVLIERISAPHVSRQRDLCSLLHKAGQAAHLRERFEDILAGKLILNLNNGICAATGMTIRASLADHAARLCYALCIQEAVAIMRSAGLTPRRVALLPPVWLGLALRLPDFVIGPWAPRLGDIDPSARSSTLQDLERGSLTEIDDLNGAIVSMAHACGSVAPVNEAVVRVVHEHERVAVSGTKPSFLSSAQLLHEIELAARRAGEPTRAMLT